MFRGFGRFLAAHSLFVFLAFDGYSQSGEIQIFKIELKTATQSSPRDYSCSLDEFRTHQRFASVDTHSDGVCSFRRVPFGDYRLTVVDPRNQPVIDQLITITQSTPPVSLDLPEPRADQRPPSGPVSIEELRRPPSRKAVSAFVSAERASEAGDYRRAAQEYARAVSLSPDFADAHQNLAVQYIRLGEYERAVQEIHRGMELAKPKPRAYCNLAFVLAKLDRYDEAIAAARDALRPDPEYPEGNYMLGMLLLRSPESRQEGLRLLRLSARTFPPAADALAKIR